MHGQATDDVVGAVGKSLSILRFVHEPSCQAPYDLSLVYVTRLKIDLVIAAMACGLNTIG